MYELVLVAASVGLSNFGAAVGIGVAGVDARTRLRVGVLIGLFEAGMPVAGLALGRSVAEAFGSAVRWTGAVLLMLTGAYALWQAARSGQGNAAPAAGVGVARLTVTALAVSVDNLVVGFALGTNQADFALAAVVIGAVSVVLSLAGLELGALVGTRIGRGGDVLGGVVLIGVGAAVGAGLL